MKRAVFILSLQKGTKHDHHEFGTMTLKAQHHSVLQKKTLPRPYGMARMDMQPDLRMFIEQEALEIFTAMVNGGSTFQQALAAIYLSGMSAAKECTE